LFLVCLAAVAGAQFLSNGSRSGMLYLFIMIGFVWALRKQRIPWRLAAIAAPLILISLGFLNVVRTAGLANQGAVEALQAAESTRILERVQAEVEQRQFIGAGVPVVARGHEVTGLALGETYVAAALGIIPRAIWEDKPRGPGSIYAQRFLGTPREGVSIPVPAFAEAYWNFHVPGVIVIFMLFGVIIRGAHEFYLTHQAEAFALAFFVVFATTFRMGTEDLVSFQQQMLMLAIVYLVSRMFASRKDKPAAMATGGARVLSVGALPGRPTGH
jgi:hypothetical protein